VLPRVRQLLSADNLKARAARGGIALAIGAFVERSARLLRNIILARILAPDQFGLMALVLASSAFFDAMTEIGLRQSVVQSKRGDSHAFLNVVWWFNAIRGVALYLIASMTAPWIGMLYQEPLLPPLLRIAFLTAILDGLVSPGLFVLEKNLKFATSVAICQGSGLVGTLITLVLVPFCQNVWALVIGFAAESAIRCTTSHVLCPFRPHLSFDVACAKEMLTFARGMAGLPILSFIVMQIDVFIVGKLCSRDILGMYSLTIALANTPLMLFGRIVQPLILPILSRYQDDKEKLRGAFQGLIAAVLSFGVPSTMCIASLGRPLMECIYGASYGCMGMTLSILSVYVVVYIITVVNASVYISIGLPGVHRKFTVLRAVLALLLTYPLVLYFSTLGAAVSMLLCLGVQTVWQLYGVCTILNSTVRSLMTEASRATIIGAAIAAPLVVMSYWCQGVTLILLVGALLCLVGWGLAMLRVLRLPLDLFSTVRQLKL